MTILKYTGLNLQILENTMQYVLPFFCANFLAFLEIDFGFPIFHFAKFSHMCRNCCFERLREFDGHLRQTDERTDDATDFLVEMPICYFCNFKVDLQSDYRYQESIKCLFAFLFAFNLHS